ncbi:hypothetical protein [Bacillus cereus group sp. TH152-1LC]|uniref:hypothetical protein n=1 Tax=Bacillus cereus group sp. TH152-1LC TaxID=3018060 RepID=UPI0022E7CD60|nr:hypothetical protein [Bacillus cereus group sp. TH152-1LC]MDA1674644.1 hypothetical protein [Bacillus cereus group sp. TH152-1LC]
MKRKRKIMGAVIASFSVFASFLDVNTVQASTDSTQVVNFDEDESNSRSQTINIPNLYKIKSVTTDNGTVSYTANGSNVTINVNGGKPTNKEAYEAPYKHSKYVSQSQSQTSSNTFPNSIRFSDGSGYSGKLNKKGTYTSNTLSWSNYTTGKVGPQDVYYNFIRNEWQQPSFSPTPKGYWTRTSVLSAMRIDSAWDHVLSWFTSGTYVNYTGENPVPWEQAGGVYSHIWGRYNSWEDCYNAPKSDHKCRYYGVNDYGNLIGFEWVPGITTLYPIYITYWSWTKQETTYTQNYEGIVYKNGTETAYRDLYSYNVTINYEEDNTPPTEGEETLPGDKLKVPQNTQCRAVDFTRDENRLAVDNDRTKFNGTDKNGNLIDKIYDLCIGSYPRFPSTSVEGGIEPYYYLKYRLLPDPMPVYNITTTPEYINGTEIIGITQKFDTDMQFEAQDKPSDKDIFLSYPYDDKHVTVAPKPSQYIRGPYQIGYNSYYHNTYRARYFASQVKYDFYVLEPKRGSEFTSDFDNVQYKDKTVLFQGTIIYDIPETCYEKEFLDYKKNCREIEFYFPKGDKNETLNPNGTRDEVTFKGNVEDTYNVNKKSKNIIPKDRVPYMNPGEHNLLVNVTENTQLRVQKDIGTEYQTVGNEDNGADNQGPWKNYLVYFGRNDRNINGKSISPIKTIKQVPTHNGKPVQSSGRVITDANGSDWTYNPGKNIDWLNYCEYNKDNWGNQDNGSKVDNGGGGSTPIDDQSDMSCYHSDEKANHFWQYSWSQTGWYAENPRPAL